MRILLTAAIAASFAVATLPALAQTAATPAKEKACKVNKDETTCSAQAGCTWSKPGDAKGKCKKAPKQPKTT